MATTLYLLDGMALAYRAYFALIRNPIINSKGVNTSALFGFTNTVLELIQQQQPSHLAIVFDTSAPTERHRIHPEYKANRDAMPEELVAAMPQLDRIARGFNIPVIRLDGYEADDIIGTLAHKAADEGFDQIFENLRVKRVQRLGAIQRYQRDAIIALRIGFDGDGFVIGHYSASRHFRAGGNLG